MKFLSKKHLILFLILVAVFYSFSFEMAGAWKCCKIPSPQQIVQQVIDYAAEAAARAVEAARKAAEDLLKSLFPDLISYEYRPSPQGSYSVSIAVPSISSNNVSSITEILNSTIGEGTSTIAVVTKKITQVRLRDANNVEKNVNIFEKVGNGDFILLSSSSIIRVLNSDIIALSIPNCMIKYTRKQLIKKIIAEVTCDTYALSANGKMGKAYYYKKDESSDWGSLGALGTINAFINNINGNPINVKENIQALNAPATYGTIENSNNLNLGTWTWSGAFLPVPTVNLRTNSSQYEISKPNNLALIGLNWSSANTNSCSASGDWSGSKPLNGGESLSKPRGSYGFTLTCLGDVGLAISSASSSVVASVIQVPKCEFSAASSTITLPETTTISWNCDYAAKCSIDQGVNSVSSESGSITVRPNQSTAYTLSCNGLDGLRTFTTSVNIDSPSTIQYKEVVPR